MPSEIRVHGVSVCLLCRHNVVGYPTQFCTDCAMALRGVNSGYGQYAAPQVIGPPGPMGPPGPQGPTGPAGMNGVDGYLSQELTDAMVRTINSLDAALRDELLDPTRVRQAITELRDVLLEFADK